MSIFDPSITSAPSAEDAAELADARANGFDTVEEMYLALEEFSNYTAESFYQDDIHAH